MTARPAILLLATLAWAQAPNDNLPTHAGEAPGYAERAVRELVRCYHQGAPTP